MKLAGKVALVTGVSPNIGGGLVEALAAEGAAVVAVDFSEANAVDCAGAVRAAGGKAIPVICDVTESLWVEIARLTVCAQKPTTCGRRWPLPARSGASPTNVGRCHAAALPRGGHGHCGAWRTP